MEKIIATFPDGPLNFEALTLEITKEGFHVIGDVPSRKLTMKKTLKLGVKQVSL